MIEFEYLKACRTILSRGHEVMDRTGVGTKMLTNVVLEHTDTNNFFPAFLTKRIAWKVLLGELLWFLEGSTSDRRLAEITFGDGDRKTIWTANWEAKPFGSDRRFEGKRSLGPVYGSQWRFWKTGKHVPRPDKDGHIWHLEETVDQIADLIEGIKKDPYGRRHLVSAWNPGELPNQSLPPCHYSFQFNVIGEKLDILVNMRSGDMFLGVPFNIASYATLLHIIAAETGYTPGKLTLVIGNAHIYLNHVDQMREQISRTPALEAMYTPPTLWMNPKKSLFKPDGGIWYKTEDFALKDYDPMPAIKGEMAV